MTTENSDNRRRRMGQRNAARKRRHDQRRLTSKKHQAHPLRLYRVGRLAELFDVDRATIWRWSKDGTLPPPIEIGGIHGWTEQQVQTLLAGDANA